jgi:UDP-N-acetylmuramoylalanine-D-glutamate ligase
MIKNKPPKSKRFNFCRYDIDIKNKKITFNYRIDFFNRESLEFTETIILPKSPAGSKEYIEKFIEPLELILGISYYKLYCPPKITTSFKLSKEQAEFWDIVYKKGLGEFLYRNKLNPKRLAKFPYSKTKTEAIRIKTSNQILLGIGGGKDSIVAAELLKDFDTTSFLIETQRKDAISESIMNQMGNPSLKIERILDPKIFEKYEGSYNGHIPISAIYAFLGLLTAYLYDYKYIVVANEHSSNFGNIKYLNETINHQWSKSAEFESLLQEYAKRFITSDITYFSLLRQFYEIRIAQMFAEHKRYHHLFSSCNNNLKVFKERPSTQWCGECPKCAFVFLMLAAFINKKEIVKIFGKNLLSDKSLIPTFRDLLGFGKLKPFDCVGTFEESRAALFLASKKFKDSIIIKTFLPKIKDSAKLTEKVLRTVPAPTLPTPFRFLGIKNVCILGYGKEGKITEQYIRKNYPELKIGILDESISKNYLEQQKKFDLAIKTPGISKTKLKIPYTTATNIFFSQNKNFTIGITGSKGKSTTSKLIYEILKTAGKKVRFIGNIGNPMLETLFTKNDPDEIFVIELSSYMLDDIEYSPDVALLLNLFPEHMNYHITIENYYRAKKNIFKFQKPGDVAIKPPFNEKIPVQLKDTSLIGNHNLQNIKAAIKVARLFDVSDKSISKALKNFKPLPHRLEFVGIHKGIKFYDDAISTTPESTIMAIKSLKNIGTIFLGGTDRGYDFNELEKIIKKYNIKNVVLFPDSGYRIFKSFNGLNILKTKSMEKAVKFAFKNTQAGQICLLSTASPSYSIWKNFEEKGNLFQNIIRSS